MKHYIHVVTAYTYFILHQFILETLELFNDWIEYILSVSGEKMTRLEKEKGIVVRFVIGHG
mgnify:CR=1 FL=1